MWQVGKSMTFRCDAPKMAEGIGIEKKDRYRIEIPVQEKQIKVKCGSLILLVNK